MIAASEQQLLDDYYTPYVVRAIYNKFEKLDFFNFAAAIHGINIYRKGCSDKTLVNCLTLADFSDLAFKLL